MKYRYVWELVDGQKRIIEKHTWDEKNKFNRPLPEGFLWVDKDLSADHIDEYGYNKYIVDDLGSPVYCPYVPSQEEKDLKEKEDKVDLTLTSFAEAMVENEISVDDLIKTVKNVKSFSGRS